MKKLILIACIILPVLSYAQQRADYERIVGNFMRFYNNGQRDSIVSQYADEWGEFKSRLWSDTLQQEIMEKYGKMRSYKFAELYKPADQDGGGDGLALFKTVFDRSTHMMAVSLDPNNKILTFRFQTSSPHLDSLLKRN